MKGLEAAAEAGVKEVAVFGAASEAFAEEHQLLHRREPGTLRAFDGGCPRTRHSRAWLRFLRARLPL